MQKIVVFDVDGTLTASTGIDDACLAAVWGKILGLRNIDTDWTTYTHSTDDGLTIEACQRGLGRVPTPGEIADVKREFFALLRTRIAATPACCPAVPGAGELLGALRSAGWRIGIASGAWEESARIKLASAGVDVAGMPGTFSHAKPGGEPAVREEIVKATLARLGAESGHATRPVYVGDGPWDARAARTLGLGFVGVRLDGNEARLRHEGASSMVRDFTKLEAALALIEAASRPPAAGARP